jgi:site-specific DNA recombinase
VPDNKTIHFIPPLPPKREKRVGIYCRVSTNSADQLKSLTAQVSALTRLTAANPKWLLVDVYIDIASSKTGSSRKEFTRMLQDCKSRDIEIVLTKSISLRPCQENFAKSIYAVSLPVASWQNVVASVPSGIGAPC